MLLDTDTTVAATTGTRRITGRQIEYLIMTALMAVTLMLLFTMGFFTHAVAAPMAGAASVMAEGRASLPRMATLADRHILIGLTLIAFAAMAATTFSLWRWQLHGLFLEVRSRGR